MLASVVMELNAIRSECKLSLFSWTYSFSYLPSTFSSSTFSHFASHLPSSPPHPLFSFSSRPNPLSSLLLFKVLYTSQPWQLRANPTQLTP